MKSLRKYGKDRAPTLLAPRLQHYLHDRILPASWYPLEDGRDLVRALEVVIHDAFPDMEEEVLVFMGRVLAQTDLSGIYASLVQKGSAEQTLRNCVLQFRTYFDSGDLRLEQVSPNQAQIEVRDFAQPSREICGLTTGWISEFLAMSGAEGVQVTETACRCQGKPVCSWSVRWK